MINKAFVWSFGIIIFTLSLTQCLSKKDLPSETSLDGKWVLESLVGFENSLKGPKGIPVIEFNLSDSSYFGHTGCNGYRGKFNSIENRIKLFPALATKVGCMDNGLEKAFLNSLGEAKRFKLDAGYLHLLNGDTVIASFAKAE